MSYSVARLLENHPPPVSVSGGATIAQALDVMKKHDCSQLPVIDPNDELPGLITYESNMRRSRGFNLKTEDDLFDLLDELKNTIAVLIPEPDKTLRGIITSCDTTLFLRSQSEDLTRIENIPQVKV